MKYWNFETCVFTEGIDSWKLNVFLSKLNKRWKFETVQVVSYSEAVHDKLKSFFAKIKISS